MHAVGVATLNGFFRKKAKDKRYDRSQTTDLNKSPTRYHTTTALTACFLLFTIQHVSCGARGERGVRAVGLATLNGFFRKKAKDKRKKRAVQIKFCLRLTRLTFNKLGVRSLTNASRARQFNPLNPPGVGWVLLPQTNMAAVVGRARSCAVGHAWSCRSARFAASTAASTAVTRTNERTTSNNPLNPPGVGWVKFFYLFR